MVCVGVCIFQSLTCLSVHVLFLFRRIDFIDMYDAADSNIVVKER